MRRFTSRRARGFKRSRRYRRRPITYGQIGRKVWRDVKFLKSVINVEKKYTDVNATTTSSSTSALVLLNGLSLGDTATTRDGQSVKFINLFWQGLWTINASATTTAVRVIVFMDTQPNAAAPATSDLLVSNTSVLSPLLISGSSRFKVLFDTKKQLSLNGTEMVRSYKFKKMSVHTKYNVSNNGTIADIVTNSIYMLHMSDQAVNVPAFSYWSRLRFIDN